MWPVKGVDIAQPIGNVRPSCRLNSACQLQGQFVKIRFSPVCRDTPLTHEAQEVAIGADIVKAVIVNTNMADVWCHMFYCIIATRFKKL